MKIRTDFVTNSSSSSYCVEIEVELNDGSCFIFETKPNEYGTNSNLECKFEDFSGIKDVKRLCNILNLSMSGTGKNKIKSFTKELSENIENIEDISSIVLRRIWTSHGESASCYIKNDQQFMHLCQKIVNSKKSDKEEAITKLREHLKNAEVYVEGGWSDKWPTEFCNSNVVPRYKCDLSSKKLENIAKKAIKEKDYGDDDLAVETIIIDMNNKVVNQSADFYIYGTDKQIGKKQAKKTNNMFANIIHSHFSGYEILEKVEITSLNSNVEDQCDSIDYLLRDNEKAIVAILVKTIENAKSKTFKAIMPVLDSIQIPYVVIDSKKDLKDLTVIGKINETIYKDRFMKYVLMNQIDEAIEIDVKPSNVVKVVKVRFEDNRAFEYICSEDINVGDIVLVNGAKAGQRGMVITVREKETNQFYYDVNKILQFND